MRGKLGIREEAVVIITPCRVAAICITAIPASYQKSLRMSAYSMAVSTSQYNNRLRPAVTSALSKQAALHSILKITVSGIDNSCGQYDDFSVK